MRKDNEDVVITSSSLSSSFHPTPFFSALRTSFRFLFANVYISLIIFLQTELGALNTTNIDHLMGLFSYDRLPYATDVTEEPNKETPPLVRMVHYSLEMLQKKEHKDGFLLFVEDGNIQAAHRENKPNKAFEQVKHYANAFNMAHMMVSETNTLVISMNDVGSTLSIPGYSVSRWLVVVGIYCN